MSEKPGAVDPRCNADLCVLTVQPGNMVPSLWGDRTEFAVMLKSGMAAVSVTAKPTHPEARMTLNGVTLEPGQPSAPVPVPHGWTVLRVETTSSDGATRKTYSLKVQRTLPIPGWRKLADSSPWVPRDSAGEIVHNGRMWLLGGYVPELVSDVWSSADGLRWDRAGDVPAPAGINIPVTFSHAGRMWVTSQDGKLFASRDGAAWDRVADSLPWGVRYGAGSAVFQGRMWVAGGISGGARHNDLWSSRDGVTWTLECAQAPWSRRQLFGNLVVHDDKLWVVGGGISAYQPFKAYRDVWSSPDGRSWSRVTDEAPWPARVWSNCVSYQGRLWLVGGFRAQPTWNNFSDIWYSSDGERWEQLEAEEIWEPRHEISVYVHDERLWVVGGNAWPLKNDVWTLSIRGLTFVSQPPLEEFVTAEYRYRARADFNRSRRPVRYRLVEAPVWLGCDEATGAVRGTPPAEGAFRIVIEAFDAAGETARQEYVLHVIAS